MAGAATTATALETRLFRLGTSSCTPEGQCRRCAFAPKQAISRICSVPSSRNLSRRCGETSAVRKQASTTQLLVSRVTGQVPLSTAEQPRPQRFSWRKLGLETSPNIEWRLSQRHLEPIGPSVSIKCLRKRHGLVAKRDLVYRAACNRDTYARASGIPKQILAVFDVDCFEIVEKALA